MLNIADTPPPPGSAAIEVARDLAPSVAIGTTAFGVMFYAHALGDWLSRRLSEQTAGALAAIGILSAAALTLRIITRSAPKP